MRKTILLVIATILLISCKEDQKESINNSTVTDENGIERTQKQNDGLTLLKGEFLYLADAAVLQTHREIYGVLINGKMHELNKMAQEFKVEDYDWVVVEVRGEISPKPEGEEGWDNRVNIKEILNVSKHEGDSNAIIKLEN